MGRTLFGAILFCVTQMASADAVDQMNGFLESTRTLRARFTQTVVSKNGKRPQLSAGMMILSRPGKFRWEITQPYRQLLVGDGEKIWMYDPDLNQVTVKTAKDVLGGTPAALLTGDGSGKGSIENDFSLREVPERGQGLEWVEATPKTSETSFEKILLGFSGKLLSIMEIHDNFGQVTALQFSGIERNPIIVPSLLRFTPPEGADVIGE